MNLFRGRNHTMKMWKIFQVTEINSCPGFPRVCHRQTSSRGTRENKKITPNQIYSFVLHCSSREFVRIFRHNSFESSVRNREKMDLTFEKFPDAIEMLARFPLFRASSSLSGCFARKNRTNNFGVARWIVSERRSCCFLPQRLWREKWSLAIKKRITVPKSRVSRSFGCIYPYTFDKGALSFREQL